MSRDFFEKERKKKMVTTFALTVGLAVVVCVTVFVMYSAKLSKEAENDLFAVTENQGNIVPNEDLEETSYSSDKGVQNVNFENSVKVELEDSQNTTSNTISNTVSNKVENSTENKVKEPINKEPVSAVVKNETNTVNETQSDTATQESSQEVKELSFQAPVAGEIIKDFAMETLIYSDTLDEWCTHSGIDIKADKTAVVSASESGKVESIKNDPRYGLTLIISHEDGFKTVYSNLLTTEFVKEGEEVEKGQTVATVGETASFEISDESHLHFEMYKDGVAVNPTIYFK